MGKLTRRAWFLWLLSLFGYKVAPVQAKPKLDPVMMKILNRAIPSMLAHDLLGPHVYYNRIGQITGIEIISPGSGYVDPRGER